MSEEKNSASQMIQGQEQQDKNPTDKMNHKYKNHYSNFVVIHPSTKREEKEKEMQEQILRYITRPKPDEFKHPDAWLMISMRHPKLYLN